MNSWSFTPNNGWGKSWVSWSCLGMTLSCTTSNRSTRKEASVFLRCNHMTRDYNWFRYVKKMRRCHLIRNYNWFQFLKKEKSEKVSKIVCRLNDLQTRLSSQLIWTRFQSRLNSWWLKKAQDVNCFFKMGREYTGRCGGRYGWDCSYAGPFRLWPWREPS